MASYLDLSQPSLYLSAASIIFNPTFWNIAARSEYHNKTITRLFNGNRLYGCYALAVTIFSLGIVRDFLYTRALTAQPASASLLDSPLTLPASYLLFTLGNTLVLTSMYALGLTGTYLGDYFGILMPARVAGFPFNVTDAPMYWGSTMSFVGTALYYGRPGGLVLCALVAVCYKVALGFEDPFTAGIYRARDEGVVGGKGLRGKEL